MEYERRRVLVWRAGQLFWGQDGAMKSRMELCWGKGAILRLRIGMACHDALFLGGAVGADAGTSKS